MGQFNDTDIGLTEDGDLFIEDGDFALVSNDNAMIQNVIGRLKSSDPEWWKQKISANLEDLLGMENNRATGQLGEELIKKALIADGLLTNQELYVQAVPTDRQNISYFIYFQSPNAVKPIGFEIKVNLNAGPSIRRITE